MHIKDVADDTAPQFPWPILITNEQGIILEDVFNAISDNFSLHVAVEEYNSWDERRRDQAGTAYWSRVRRTQSMHSYHTYNDGLRRFDYMGDRVMFRGLEPSPRKDGTWMLFVGPF
jgi:hypothetical protein